ncbi:MAG TPA: hypothetical protein VGO47_04610 [Chlamydiales bacterium]|nr:hypothetical protein [Chlamydiales bacterium]
MLPFIFLYVLRGSMDSVTNIEGLIHDRLAKWLPCAIAVSHTVIFLLHPIVDFDHQQNRMKGLPLWNIFLVTR